MNSVNYGKLDAIPRLQLFNCVHAECGARFTREWRLKEHETIHTGARPLQCPQPDCGRRFSRRSHLSRHNLSHTGAKQFRCSQADCSSSFFNVDKLKRHVLYAHGDKDTYFKCRFPECHLMFRKRSMYKMHLKEHGISPNFRCQKEGCGALFDTSVARRAHERTHAGYSCPLTGCQVLEHTWGRMCKHAQTHPVTYTCKQCQVSYGRREALRRHRRSHALQKPVLLCPRQGCQTYFSTIFNLQHHIRKVHLQLLKYRCSYPACTRAFAMRESLNSHMVHHDPHGASLKQPQQPQQHQRSSKKWQKRLKGCQYRPLVEEDLRRLFALRLRFPRRTKVEADLSGLFNERKIPRPVSPEVNLQQLFSLKPPGNQGPPQLGAPTAALSHRPASRRRGQDGVLSPGGLPRRWISFGTCREAVLRIVSIKSDLMLFHKGALVQNSSCKKFNSVAFHLSHSAATLRLSILGHQELLKRREEEEEEQEHLKIKARELIGYVKAAPLSLGGLWPLRLFVSVVPGSVVSRTRTEKYRPVSISSAACVGELRHRHPRSFPLAAIRALCSACGTVHKIIGHWCTIA
ncbi:hypothetical protein SKAU_G00289500 [Synaphobranchus kaupii]|uniref:C2H2-type domain-containing protein n=1 Tax=Synaphobranchus kaupii TaxID=118154 RepID=A0A9Q1IL66_SYNKA|nr:hypothetical protein SKAU_G00289500 [Synaphobranchus kaupii]